MFRIVYIIFCSLIIHFSLAAQQAEKKVTLSGYILHLASHAPIPYATIQLYSGRETFYGAATDTNGYFKFSNIPKDRYKTQVSSLGYQALDTGLLIRQNDTITLYLTETAKELHEVIVTATELKSITSTSRIGRDAMKHIQPGSFTDLLALLPGGKSSDPATGQANLVRLREAGSPSENFDISSLGTQFQIDGMPISTDANMQYVAQGTGVKELEYTGKGVDMRGISTDQIESVEVVRGIPSVEYGDLTSGIIMIHRKKGLTPWEARFKADQYGKLFSLGKGIQYPKKQIALNGGIDYLDSKTDPRDNLFNYKRITGSVRLQKRWLYQQHQLKWNISMDYTGSMDNQKYDPDISDKRDDKYKSAYNRVSLANKLLLNFPAPYKIRSLEFSNNLSFSSDKIRQQKQIFLNRDFAIPNSTEEGEHDGVALPYEYTAHLLVDGQPFSAYTKLKVNFRLKAGKSIHRLATGIEWNIEKNFGRGQVYDITRPLNTTTNARPRSYRNIKAGHKLSFFAEDNFFIPVRSHRLNIIAGARGMTLLNLGNNYSLQGKIYLDPRVNARWTFPAFPLSGQNLQLAVGGGMGWHTKMPVLLQLFPEKIYRDILQLDYYHDNPEYRRINMKTYITDPVNYSLKAARNRKWEIHSDATYGKHNLAVTYFEEKLTSGFRNTKMIRPIVYKKYDIYSIDAEKLQGPPQLNSINWKADTILDGYSRITNGSTLIKKGIEFQYASPRIRLIKTRLTINGAWFKTIYRNSEAQFDNNITTVIGNTAVNNKYVGLYDWIDGSIKQSFNTNFILDTYLQKLGLSFSGTVECYWSATSRNFRKEGTPVAYMDVTGTLRPYTASDAQDTYKQWLKQSFSEAAFEKQSDPFYMYVNLKATKEFGKTIRLALFVNRLLDYTPDFTSKGVTIRRNVAPYFGMELNITI